MRKDIFKFLLVSALCLAGGVYGQEDWRNIRSGVTIFEHGYCDQPYTLVLEDGRWFCTFTTGEGHEGDSRQFIAATTSRDQGRTWSEIVKIEEPGLEASWAMPFLTPYGRIYVFYDYNGDGVGHGKPEYRLKDGSTRFKADMLGWYCFKYSDDGGRTWSKRYRLPVRVTEVDRRNTFEGKVQIMWGIGKPIVQDGSMYFAFTKIRDYELCNSEGWFFRSGNILTEKDAEKLNWEMLPEGDKGLRNPEQDRFSKSDPRGWGIQAEQNIVPLESGGLYCMYRTTAGYPCHAYSRDGARTWTLPEAATYTPGGRRFKHPRACPRIWKTKSGRYLFWFHNHGGKTFSERNPAWICGGIEKDGMIHWSQPEILLYDAERATRTSYPDLIEQDGEYWFTETQKTTARVHKADKALIEGLWEQGRRREVTQEGLMVSLNAAQLAKGHTAATPFFRRLSEGQGLSFDFWVRLDTLDAGQVIADTMTADGRGVTIRTTDRATLEIVLGDGNMVNLWDCDRGLLKAGQRHHAAIIVDGQANIITFVMDGVLCDGGGQRQYGWGRISPDMGYVRGTEKLKAGYGLKGELSAFRMYGRYLTTSEAVSHYHAGVEDPAKHEGGMNHGGE